MSKERKKKKGKLGIIIIVVILLFGCSGLTKNNSRHAGPSTHRTETKAETKASETKASETKAPETKAPETQMAETEAPQTEVAETKAPETEAAKSAGIRPDFKKAMDEYEEFYAQYCEFIKAMEKDPTNLSMLTEYAKLMIQLEEVDKAFEKWESEDLNDEELEYYLDVNNRVMKMLLSVQ